MRCSLEKGPTRATIELLAPIWERVLQRPSVCAEDNFFDLGGDPSLAVQLFREIAEAFGRELPPLTIYQAPTLGELADLLEMSTTPPFPILVRMKNGDREPPIFITHGLGGSIMEISHLVRGLQSRHPIYGLQCRGFDGKTEPLTSIGEMAEFYLEAIREVQPHGPYALIGYSFGGLVIMEIARRLRKSGEKVVLVAMVETFPHRNLLPLWPRLRVLAGLAKLHADILGRLPARKWIGYLTSRAERFRTWRDRGVAREPPESGLSFAPALERFHRATELAFMHYRPRFYPGKINFVRAAKSSPAFPEDPGAIWGKLAEEFEIETTPGDHFEIVTTSYRELAAILSRHLAAAFPGE